MILVTGSSGFVGKHLVHTLTQRNEEIVVADRVTGQDLTDISVVEQLFEGIDISVIVHLASSCSTPGSVRDPLGTFRDTVLTAVNILEVARRDRIPVILTSSVKARDGQTPYGAAKRMTELWALEYRSAYHLPVIINRPGTIYGPGQEGSEESGWIAWFCEAKASEVPVLINGDGQQVRDLLHVSDYVRLLLLQIDDPLTYDTGHIYDIGGGEDNAVTVQQVADHLGLVYTFGPDRYGDSRRYVALNDAPGWGPRIKWSESRTLNDDTSE